MNEDTINFTGENNEKQGNEGIAGNWISDSSFDCIFVTEKEICRYQNITARETFGYSDEEINGLSISKLFTPKYSDTVKSFVLVGHEDPFKLIGRKKDGTEFECIVRCRTIIKDNKTFRLTTIYNLSNFSHLYKETAIKDRILQDTIDNLPALVWFKDIDGKLIKVNKEFLKTAGKNNLFEVLGKTDFEIWDKDAAEKYSADHERIIKTKKSLHTEDTVVCNDEKKIFETYKKPVYSETGAIAGSVGVAIDITERKQAEEKIKVSEARYRAVAQSANEAIVTIDINGIIVDWNNSAKRIFGYTLAEILGKPITILMNQKYYSHHLNKFNDIQKRKESAVIGKSIELEAYRKDGSAFPMELSLSKWESPEGIFFTGIIKDISVQRDAFKKVEESEGFLNNILNSVSEPIFVKNIDHEYVIVNEAYCKLIGYKKEDLIGKKDSDYFPSGEVEIFLEKDVEIFETGIANINEEPFTDRKGNLHIIITKKSLYVNNKGDKFVVGVINDITEQKKYQKELEESEEKYKFIVESSTDGISIVENDNIVYTSDMFYKLSGLNYSGRKFKDTIISIIDKRDIANIISEIERGRSEKLKKQTLVYRITDVRGKTVWLQDELNRFFDDDGNHTKTLVVSRNITEKKIAEDKLIESERKLRESQTIAGIGNYETDLETMTWTSSELLTKIFGLDENFHYTINNWLSIIHIEDRERVAKYFKEVTEKNLEIDIEYRFIRQNDKQERWARALGIIKYDAKGKPEKLLGTVQDITVKKKLELELIEAKEKAEASSRLKTAFLNNISHEIRTPLNGIIGFGELISQSGLTHEAKQSYLKNLQKSTKRLIDTVTDYMDISMVVSGSMNVIKKDINVTEFLNGIYEDYKTAFENKGIKFLLTLPENVDSYKLHSDSELLEKVLSHLISNAVKFTQTGEVTFGLRDSEQGKQFFITDTGIGIAKENLSLVFEKFSQENEGMSRNYEGNGLGLSIVKGIVELLGGQIYVESEKNIGSVFSFTLNNDVWKEDNKKQNSEIAKGLKRPVILIVEDDDINMYFLETYIKGIKCDYYSAVNGLEAVEMCKNNSDINLVLMDLKLPVMDGYKATSEIKKFRSDLTIIAVTAHAMAGDEAKAIDAGCDGYIPKPITGDGLLTKIKEMGFDL